MKRKLKINTPNLYVHEHGDGQKRADRNDEVVPVEETGHVLLFLFVALVKLIGAHRRHVRFYSSISESNQVKSQVQHCQLSGACRWTWERRVSWAWSWFQ